MLISWAVLGSLGGILDSLGGVLEAFQAKKLRWGPAGGGDRGGCLSFLGSHIQVIIAYSILNTPWHPCVALASLVLSL